MIGISVAATETFMHSEAGACADVVRRQLKIAAPLVRDISSALRADPPQFVVTCARGSSDHAATFAKHLFETRLGWMTASAAPSVFSVYESRPKLAGSLFVAISQSGRSPDLLRAAAVAREQGARLLVMVNDLDSPLARMADWTFPLSAGPEKSVAATKTYIATLSGLFWLVSAVEQPDPGHSGPVFLPALLSKAWLEDWSSLVRGLVLERGLFVIGRGGALGVAQEAALKFKETCGLHAEAFSAAEVRHGPMALAATGLPVLIFRQDDASADGVDGLARDLVRTGVKVWVVGKAIDGAQHLPTQRADPMVQPILQIQSFYAAVNQLSVARGNNPDVPPLLRKITETV